MPEFTDAQLLGAIQKALDARDMPAVAAFVRVLAVQSPHDAQAILDALALAQAAVPEWTP